MLVRALRLRNIVKKWIGENHRFTPFELMEDEWRQVDPAIMLLKPFAEYIHDISASTRPGIHNAYFIYNNIFEHIARHSRQVRNLPDAPQITGLLDESKGSKKVLQKYYSNTTQKGFIYNIATILELSKKLTIYNSWGNVQIQDPEMQVGITNSVSYSDFYRYFYHPLNPHLYAGWK